MPWIWPRRFGSVSRSAARNSIGTTLAAEAQQHLRRLETRFGVGRAGAVDELGEAHARGEALEVVHRGVALQRGALAVVAGVAREQHEGAVGELAVAVVAERRGEQLGAAREVVVLEVVVGVGELAHQQLELARRGRPGRRSSSPPGRALGLDGLGVGVLLGGARRRVARVGRELERREARDLRSPG